MNIELKDRIVVNCTKHDINEIVARKVYPRGKSNRAYVVNDKLIHDDINGSPVQSNKSKKIYLPSEQENTFFIVSSLVLGAAEKANLHRNDLIAPGNIVTNDKGKTIGCEGFRSYTFNPNEPENDLVAVIYTTK